MPKAKTSIARRAKKPSDCRLPREVSSSELTHNLLGLFQELGLGVDKAKPTLRHRAKRDPRPADSLLYQHTSAIGQMLTAWHQDPSYLDDFGSPAPIKLKGPAPSFQKLAQEMVPSVSPSYLSAELQRLGVISLDGTNLARVHMRSFPVYEDKRLAAIHTLSMLDGFISTLRHNLKSGNSNSEQLFHRIAWNGDFKKQEIPALKVRVRKHGRNFLYSFDDWLTRRSASNSHSEKNKKSAQVTIGVYLSIDS